MQFRLDGVQEALANLKSIGEAVTDRNLQEDALVAVEPIAEDARSLAPVDQGDLRDSIQAIQFEDGTVGVIIGDWKGHFWEFGTVNHRAQPMLAPAWDAHADRLAERFGEMVKVRIERVTGGNRSRTGLRVTGDS